jgi:hypothetical protein
LGSLEPGSKEGGHLCLCNQVGSLSKPDSLVLKKNMKALHLSVKYIVKFFLFFL